MAHDQTKKIEIRAWYESHNATYKETAEHFSSTGYEINHKTIEHWGGKDKWVKGRYASLTIALDKLIDDTVIDVISKDAKKIVRERIEEEHKGEIIEPDILDAMTDEISAELVWHTLNKKALAKEVAINLINAKKIVQGSRSIGTNATYHDMLLKSFYVLNGKDEKIPLPNPNQKSKIQKPLSEMTMAELQELKDEE